MMSVPPPARALTPPARAAAKINASHIICGKHTRPDDDARPLRRRPAQAGLAAKGYQPARSDIEPLFALVATGDRDQAEAASRALARLGSDAATAALARFDGAAPVMRARLTRLVGRVAQKRSDRALGEWLVGASPTATRRPRATRRWRSAGSARSSPAPMPSGRSSPDGPRRPRRSSARWPRRSARSAPPTRSPLLDPRRPRDDAEVRRVVDEARLKLTRTLGRDSTHGAGAIRDDLAPTAPVRVIAHCRHGLSTLLADELAPTAPPSPTTNRSPSPCAARSRRLWSARTMLRFGFPLPAPRGQSDLEARSSTALTSDEAGAHLSRFTDGTTRYRMEWAEGGHRRGLTFRVAAGGRPSRPSMVNNPTATSVGAVVTRDAPDRRRAVAARPRPIRASPIGVAHVPASSHPTLAAALARVGGVRADDVVWDPFVGAATELIERARLGPYASCTAPTSTSRPSRAPARTWPPPGITRRARAAPTRATFRPQRRRRSSSPTRRWGGACSTARSTGALYATFLAPRRRRCSRAADGWSGSRRAATTTLERADARSGCA